MIVNNFAFNIKKSDAKNDKYEYEENIMYINEFIKDIYLFPLQSIINFMIDNNIELHPTNLFMFLLPYLEKFFSIKKESILKETINTLQYFAISEVYKNKWNLK